MQKVDNKIRKSVSDNFYELLGIAYDNADKDGVQDNNIVDPMVDYIVLDLIPSIRAEERKKTLEEVNGELEQIELNQMPSNTLYTDKDVVVSLFEMRKILSKITKRGK